MGKIVNFQNKYNKIREKNFEQDTQISKKEKLRIRSFKDIGTLLGPNASKYKLSKNQRNFQLKGRITIAAIAAALSISGGAAAISNHVSQDTNKQTEQILETLDKDSVLSEANSRLKQYVFGKDAQKAYIQYVYNKDDNSTSILVGKANMDSSFSYNNQLFINNIRK